MHFIVGERVQNEVFNNVGITKKLNKAWAAVLRTTWMISCQAISFHTIVLFKIIMPLSLRLLWMPMK